jgi:dTDP-4-dehydrorhamnose reductase
MKVLVTGANGQLGSELRFLTKENIVQFSFVNSKELDVTDAITVENLLRKENYDYVVNCAAYTAVDLAETEIYKAEKVNVIGVENLAKSCHANNACLIHISTDFVFDGSNNVPYKEGDQTNPLSVYGATKLAGEKKIVDSCDKHFIIRTSWLYSSFGNNFVKTMLRLGETKKELGVIVDQVGTPTYARDLGGLVLKIISDSNTNFGLYHYSNNGVASWYDFAKAIFDIKGINITVNPIPSENYPTPAVRPKFSVLNKSKVKAELYAEVPYWRDSLESMLSLV